MQPAGRLPDTALSVCAHVQPGGPRVSGSRVAVHTCAASASAGVDFASYSPERVEEARSQLPPPCRKSNQLTRTGQWPPPSGQLQGLRIDLSGMCMAPGSGGCRWQTGA